MKHYLVTWEIDVWAHSPREAAEQARQTQLNPDSLADVFGVIEHDKADGVSYERRPRDEGAL
jgi:hypothetical protein